LIGKRQLGVAGIELVGKPNNAGQRAVTFFVEARRDGFDGVGEQIVIRRVEWIDGETRFNGGELSNHLVTFELVN